MAKRQSRRALSPLEARLLLNQMNVVSYGTDLSRRMVQELEKARRSLERVLASLPESAVYTREFNQMVQQQVLGTLHGLKAPMVEGMDSARAALIGEEYSSVTRALLTSAGKGGVTVAPLLPVDRLAAILDGPVGGRPMGEWVDRHLGGLKDGIRSELAQTVIQGESAADARRALQGQFGISRNGADVIARTGLLQAASDAREAVYSDHSDLVSSWTYLATLDARTCIVCMPDDGRTTKTRGELPKVPRHPRCRCIIRPNTEFTEPMERPAVRETERIEREAKSGGRYTEFKQRDVVRVPDSTDYETFFRSQPAGWQREVLGPKRHDLWSEGKVSLDEMRGVNDRVLSVEELKERFGDRRSGAPRRSAEDQNKVSPVGSLSPSTVDAERSVERMVRASEPDAELHPVQERLYSATAPVSAEEAVSRLDVLPATDQFAPGERARWESVKNPVLKSKDVAAVDFDRKLVEPFGKLFAASAVEQVVETKALRVVQPAVRKSRVAELLELPEEAFTEGTFELDGVRSSLGWIDAYRIGNEIVVKNGNHRATAALLRGWARVRVRVVDLVVADDGTITLRNP